MCLNGSPADADEACRRGSLKPFSCWSIAISAQIQMAYMGVVPKEIQLVVFWVTPFQILVRLTISPHDCLQEAVIGGVLPFIIRLPALFSQRL